MADRKKDKTLSSAEYYFSVDSFENLEVLDVRTVVEMFGKVNKDLNTLKQKCDQHDTDINKDLQPTFEHYDKQIAGKQAELKRCKTQLKILKRY